MHSPEMVTLFNTYSQPMNNTSMINPTNISVQQYANYQFHIITTMSITHNKHKSLIQELTQFHNYRLMPTHNY